jgi:hypothetical protein
MMIAEAGLERPVSASDTNMAAGQGKGGMPDPSDVALDRDSIATHIAEAQERAHPLAGAMEARADLRSAVNWMVDIGIPPTGEARWRARDSAISARSAFHS